MEEKKIVGSSPKLMHDQCSQNIYMRTFRPQNSSKIRISPTCFYLHPFLCILGEPAPFPETLDFNSLVNGTELVHILLTGYVVQGSNGEYVYLRDEERVELVRQAAKMASSDKIIVAGAGCECKFAGI